jgi:hypothetical protein
MNNRGAASDPLTLNLPSRASLAHKFSGERRAMSYEIFLRIGTWLALNIALVPAGALAATSLA